MMDSFPHRMDDDGEGRQDDSSWLGETDAVLLEEDDGRNRKQAMRNRRIRGMLLESKQIVHLPKSQGFAEVDLIDDTVEKGKVESSSSGSAAPPWFSHRDEPSVSLRLHEELLDFANFIRPSEEEAAARRKWAAAIEAAATSLWSACEVRVFGSSSTGLCLPNADVDVAITGLDAGVRVTTAMKHLAEKLLELGEVSKVELIQSAKVPVMKLQQRSTGLMADVIFNRVDGLETSKFIREQMESFPALSPLVLFIKFYLMQRNLHETFMGGMGSYLLVCVVLSFLQQHPSASSPQIFAKTTLGNLLLDLFRYYGQDFRYGMHGISVLNGGSLFDREARGWNSKDRNGRPTLCLESPLEPTVDIGSRCFKIGVVRAAFNHGYHVLGSRFVAREAPGTSLLCPALLHGRHPVISSRHTILQEQAPALLAEAKGVIEDSDDDEDDLDDGPPKRRKLLSAGVQLESQSTVNPATTVAANAVCDPVSTKVSVGLKVDAPEQSNDEGTGYAALAALVAEADAEDEEEEEEEVEESEDE